VSRNTAILVQDLVKVYRLGGIEVQALRGLNLSVSEKSITSIIGPSGSGKSTLLNILGGLDRATAGYVRIMGVDLTNLNPSQLIDFRRSKIGYLFQNMNLIPSLNAAENIGLPLAARGVDSRSRKTRVNELLELVGLENRAKHMPHQLSGGEQQRIALATALSNDPPLILVDEPTADLDSENANIIVDYLVKTRDSQGKTIVMATHDPKVARAGDRILRIGDGVIIEDVKSIESHRGIENYEAYIRIRVNEIKEEASSLGSEFKTGRISTDIFARRHKLLKEHLEVLEEEIQRLGSLSTK